MHEHPHTDHMVALQVQRLQSLRAPAPNETVLGPSQGGPDAAGRTHVEPAIAPPTAAHTDIPPRCWALWITCRTVPIVVFVITISHPFPEVPRHVICTLVQEPLYASAGVCCVNAPPVSWESRRLACCGSGLETRAPRRSTLAQDLCNGHRVAARTGNAAGPPPVWLCAGCIPRCAR